MKPRRRGILYSKTVRHPGRRPPESTMRRLRKVYPWVHIDWDTLRRCWTLWEAAGRHLTHIADLRTPEGKRLPASIPVVFRILDRAKVRGRILNRYDLDHWLEEIDADPPEVVERRRLAMERIREGSDRLFSALRQPLLITVPR